MKIHSGMNFGAKWRTSLLNSPKIMEQQFLRGVSPLIKSEIPSNVKIIFAKDSFEVSRSGRSSAFVHKNVLKYTRPISDFIETLKREVEKSRNL